MNLPLKGSIFLKFNLCPYFSAGILFCMDVEIIETC
jgi:hypothetical protein